MKTIAASLAAALVLAGPAPALAQSPAQPPGLHDPAKVEAGAYLVDPAHTQVTFTVSHMGFSPYSGTFSGASGELALDPKNAAASALKVTVPIASVMTTSAKLDEELKGARWLDVARFPDMSFVSTKVTPKGRSKARVDGELTIHGVSRPATLDVSFVGAGTNPLDEKYTVGFEATGEIKRSDFGVATFVPMIGDALRLRISGAFERR